MHQFFFSFCFLLASMVVHSTNYDTFQVSKKLQLIQLAPNVYVHVSLSEVEGYGTVSSNGLVVVNPPQFGTAHLYDTPMENDVTLDLYQYVRDSLGVTITECIPTHWHDDCLGGMQVLKDSGVIFRGGIRTQNILKAKGLDTLDRVFEDVYHYFIHGSMIKIKFYGEGHALDNLVVYDRQNQILFGGCLVRSSYSKSMGNTRDGNINSWSKTVKKVKRKFKKAEIVITGHGPIDDRGALKHTIRLAKQAKKETN
jgi:metallo-beta-lactamase class B